MKQGMNLAHAHGALTGLDSSLLISTFKSAFTSYLWEFADSVCDDKNQVLKMMMEFETF